MIEELRKWNDRAIAAQSSDEPLYVTTDELADIACRFSAPVVPDDARFGPRSSGPYFLGMPVVIDAEKAAEQRSRGEAGEVPCCCGCGEDSHCGGDPSCRCFDEEAAAR